VSVSDARLELLLETLELRLDILVAAPAAPALSGLARLLEKAVKLQSNPYCGVAEVGLAL